jgi:hypothetical protein
VLMAIYLWFGTTFEMEGVKPQVVGLGESGVGGRGLVFVPCVVWAD